MIIFTKATRRTTLLLGWQTSLLKYLKKFAGISVEEFMEFSAHRQVSLHYAETDLAEDRATADRLKL